MTLPLPLHRYLYWEQHFPEAVFLRQPINRQWKTWTFRQAGEEIRCIAATLTQAPAGSGNPHIGRWRIANPQ